MSKHTSKPGKHPIRDRVKELRRVKASELRPCPHNWRLHPEGQKSALEGILQEIGFAGALIARELADGSLELIDGHLRAETTPDMVVPVLVLDVDETEAKKILVSYDPLSAMANADAEALGLLLAEVETDNDALQAMLDELASQAGVEGADGKVKEISILEPPSMAWVLVGIPTVRFGEIAETIECIATIPGVLCEMTMNSKVPDSGEQGEES